MVVRHCCKNIKPDSLCFFVLLIIAINGIYEEEEKKTTQIVAVFSAFHVEKPDV